MAGIYIDGGWRPSAGSDMFTIINPYTEQAFAQATIGNEADVDAAVRSAHRALHGSWSQTTVEERIAIVRRIQAGLVARADEIAKLNSSSLGSVYSSARSLGNASGLIDMYIEMVRKVCFEYLRMDDTGDALIVRRPVGVVAGIVPWNAPVRAEVKKAVPALLAGCTVVLKPAPQTPFGAAAFAEVCSEAGVPPGVVNVVPGAGSTGDHLVRHPLVRKVAFTGSSATGSKIWAATADSFKRMQLELGGKSAAILLDDANLDEAVPWLSAGIFPGAGQMCTATSRLLAPRSRYEEVVAAMADAAQGYVMGDPFDPETTLGPLVTEKQRDRVLTYIKIGQSEGAKVVTGGGRPLSQSRGWFVEPTVFAAVDNSMRIAREEIFGPVLSVIPYGSEDEAIEIANDNEYGLGGAVHSADPRRALAVARHIDSGFVSVNRYRIPDSVPFGGVKRSGIGREHGSEGYDSYLEYVPHPIPHDFAEQLARTTPVL